MWLFVQRSGLGHHIGSGRLCDHENTHPYACCKDVGGHHLKKEQIDRVATVMATILVSGLTEQCQKLTPAADPGQGTKAGTQDWPIHITAMIATSPV
ncbi:hypothetical protein SMMN14_02051 [Sphaerulina musiva]